MHECLEKPGSLECQVVIIDSFSQSVRVKRTGETLMFPRVLIPAYSRPAQELRNAIDEQWGLEVFVLEFLLLESSSSFCVIVELLSREAAAAEFSTLRLDMLPASLLPEVPRAALTRMLNGVAKSPVSRPGWIDAAIAWAESETGGKLTSKQEIEQLNAGGSFALVCLPMQDGKRYWLKATGAPNAHELAITHYISAHFPDATPRLIAVKKEWNAWITEEAGCRLPADPSEGFSVRAARQFALLQLRSTTHVKELLASGAWDLRLPNLMQSIDPVMDYLLDAMARQPSTKVSPLTPKQIKKLATVLRAICIRTVDLGIPDALIHNDLSLVNTLDDGCHCVFTDWCEAAISNPFLACERLCQLNVAHSEQVRGVYRELWSKDIAGDAIDEAMVYMPLLAIYAYLYGRGNWIVEESPNPRLESYARSLARHMYRAAESPVLSEALCR